MDTRETIGIIGGGQLGQMLTLAAQPLGFHVLVVDPGTNSPAAQVGAAQIVADLYDATALQQLAERSDYLTIEIEHLDTTLLDDIARLGKPVNPAPATIAMIQDKLVQKQFLEQAGIPVAPFTKISDEAAAKKALRDFGGNMLLKTRRGAYDGRGNLLVSSTSDIKKAFQAFEGQPLYAEKCIPFQKELAVMIARGLTGETALYPVVETVQERNICIEVLAPAPITKLAADTARQVALKVAAQLEGAGVFGIELFLTTDNQILVNEIAPRVHNSGHYTTEACATSQFEQHIRAITGLPLGSTEMIVPAAVMVNILGERNAETRPQGIDKANKKPHTRVHVYGKSPTKIDRKMGHITSVGDTLEVARQRAHQARAVISI
jgi:5-(carboxyamino)imidazole ribonucleotide synthase